MDLSLMICTWNNQEILKRTLESLRLCEIPVNLSWECIVVNNNSTDGTESAVLSFKDKLPLKYVFEPQQGLSNARNAGLKASTGKLILFGDDDIEPYKDWIKSYWEAYQEHPSGYYWGGPIESTYEKGELPSELIPVAPGSVKGFDRGKNKIVINKDDFFLGANWACPAEILKNLGGFDINKGLNHLTGRIRVGEDTVLMLQLKASGWQGIYIPEARIKHFVPFKKMNLEHIASRWEASGFENADQYEKYLKNPLLFGVPRWMVKKALLKWLKYLYLRITCQKWHHAYVTYREYLGFLKGLKEIGKNKKA